MLSCCSPPVFRLMTEWELRRGTALSLTSPLQWTQSPSSTATPRRKVCLFVPLYASFFQSFTLYSFQLLIYSHWDQDSHSSVKTLDSILGVGLWLTAVFYLWKCGMFVRLCPPGSRSLSSVASLESPVICCLGPLIQYLQEFNLERVLRSERYTQTNVHTHTLNNIEDLSSVPTRHWDPRRAETISQLME